MRNNSLSYAQEAWNDEQWMLRYSCIGSDEFDAEYTRRDIQREKSLMDSIEEAYEEYEK